MADETRTKKIPAPVYHRRFPLDLMLVMIWLAASIAAIYLPILNGTIVKVVFALPVVLFIPGYCFIATLFPKNDDIGIS